MNKLQNAPITKGMKVFVRCDLDVPVDHGKIKEKYRLAAAIETLNFIINKGGIPVIAGHVGKPEGKVVENLSTKQLLPYFDEMLGKDKYELLENLRFDAREEKNDTEYAKELASKAEIYVNESFATSHRSHTSIVSVPKLLPHFAGFRLQKEIETLGSLIKSSARPFVSIVGGSKLESKMPVISKLLKISDTVMLGGKIALSWTDPVPANLILPVDDFDTKDIGTKTIEKFKEILRSAKTVFWAGPLGMYETDLFARGTREIAQEISDLTKSGAIKSVVGGGDTIAAIQRTIQMDRFTFASTGGGASLQYLTEETLPGIEVLN